MPTAKFRIDGEVVRIPYQGERPTLEQARARVKPPDSPSQSEFDQAFPAKAAPPGFVQGAPPGFEPEVPAPASPAMAASPLLWRSPLGEIRRPTAWQSAQQTGANLLERIGMNPQGAQRTAEMLVPGSQTDAWIQGALMATPGVGKVLGAMLPEVRAASPLLMRTLTRAGRVALPTTAGAVGGELSGEGAGAGAKRGAEVSATGEVLATPMQWLTRSVAGPIMQRLDAARLSKMATEIAPALTTVKSPAELHRLVMGTTGEELIGQALQRELTPVLRATQGQVFHFPVLDAYKGQLTPVSFERALEELRRIGTRGYTATGDLRGAINAVEARQLRHDLRQQMTEALENPSAYVMPSMTGTPTSYVRGIPIHGSLLQGVRSPQTARQFDQAMKQYSRGREVIDVLSDPRVWEGGRLNMRALQELVGTEEYKGLGRTLKQDAQKFYDAVYRGGSALTRDVQGSLGLHARLYPGAGVPHFGVSMPRLPSYGGPEAPALARKGATAGPIVSFGMLGLTRESPSEE